MTWLLLILISVQSVLLVAAQIFLKIAVQLFGRFTWTFSFFKTVFTTWQFAASGLCAISGMIVWMVVLKRFEFSVAYPLLSISYVIGLIAAQLIFHETVPLSRWIGVAIIMLGVYFVVK